MSPRRFDGWEPQITHIPHYDERGRITHVTEHREPEWSKEDRIEAEALLLSEALTCKGCAGWLPETTKPTFIGRVDDGICYSCRSLEIVRRTHAKSHEQDPEPAQGRPRWDDGLRFGVRPATRRECDGAHRPE